MLPARSGKIVTIREVEADDLDLVWEWENDSEMGLYLNADPGKHMSMDEVKRRFQQYRTDPTSGLFIICTRDGEAIGMLGFDRLLEINRHSLHRLRDLPILRMCKPGMAKPDASHGSRVSC